MPHLFLTSAKQQCFHLVPKSTELSIISEMMAAIGLGGEKSVMLLSGKSVVSFFSLKCLFFLCFYFSEEVA